MRKCEIDGCTNQHRARGFCIVHYNNWVRYESGAGKFETKFRAAERERIIKLLQQQGPALQPIIALIKGETNG